MNATIMQALAARMDEEDTDTVVRMLELILAAMLHPEGAVVLLVDRSGEGVAEMVTAGNEAKTPMLMHAASSIADQIYGRPEEAVLQ